MTCMPVSSLGDSAIRLEKMDGFGRETVAKEFQEQRPDGYHWLSLIPLPAIINLPHRPQSLRHILLPQPQSQPPVPQVLAKCAGLGYQALFPENEGIQS